MISNDFVEKYTAQRAGNEGALGFVENIDDFAASSIVDIGTSLFNSVIAIPKLLGVNTDEYRIETYDVLKSVNEDWAEYYRHSKDLVETASFLGGALLPAGLAFKGMKVLQAGKLGFYPAFLSDTAQSARIGELQKMLELGQKATPEFRNLRWKILAANAGQETAQAAGAELAVFAGLNQHVWMEDYLKDPVQNFTIGLALGGVLGTGIGQLQVRKQLRDALGPIATESLDKVVSKLIDIPLGISDVDKVQRFSVNANILRGIVDDESQTPLVRQIAEDFAIKWEGMAGKLEQTTVFGPGLKALKEDPEALQQARSIMLSDAAYGANRVDLFTYEAKEFVKQRGVSGALMTREARDAAKSNFVRDFEYTLSPGLPKTSKYGPEGTVFSITDKEGKHIGHVDVTQMGNSLFVHHIGVGTGPNSLGVSAMRDIAVQLRAEFPNAVEITGERVSGIRDAFLGGPNAMTSIKFGNSITSAAERLSLWTAGQKIRTALIASEGLKRFTPDWAKLMQREFTTYYSPYHKAWIPASEIQNYSRAVDTGVTTWEMVNIYKPNVDAFTEFAVREIPTANADKYWINTLGSVAATRIEPSVYMMSGDLGVQNAWLSRLSQLEQEEKKLPRIFLIPEEKASSSVSEMRKFAKEITLKDLEQNLLERKEREIKNLLNAGASIQEIGIRLNIPQNTLERHLLEGKSLEALGSWRNYLNAGDIDSQYLAQKTRTLSFTTNGHRVASLAFRNADKSANLDAKAIKYANKELMATIIAGGESSIARQFFATLNKDDKIWDLFEQQLSNIVNEKSGSFFFSSADFASRDMGDIGRIATQKGQEFFGLANNISEQMLTPVAAKLRATISTQIGINEFNEVVNLLQSTKGYRDIDPVSGQLFKLVEQEPGTFVKVPLRYEDGSDATVELSQGMKEFLLELRSVSRELWHMKNTLNKIQGFKELNDIGLWIPAFNPINKFISYVIDTQAPEDVTRVKLLMGKTPEELANLEQRWKANNGASTRYRLITKAQQEDYNFWQMRQDPTEMDFADISKFHSGASASAVPTFDDAYASTIIENLHNRIIFYGRKMQEMYLDDIMSTLDTMSAVNQKYFANQPTLLRAAGLAQREDAARSIKNVLLGNNQLGAYSTWQTVNNGFSSMIEFSSRKIQEAYRGFFEYDEKARLLRKGEFEKFSKELESVGVKNPFQDFNDYIHDIKVDDSIIASASGAQSTQKLHYANMLEDLRTKAVARKLGTNYDNAEKIIAAGNSTLATLALRVMETGHAVVTAVSWPIMMLPEFYRQMPKTYLGNALGEGVEVAFPARAIYDGIRFRHSDAAKPLVDRWIREGYGASIVSEATKLNELINTGGQGAIGKINAIMQSDLIKKLSIPSDFAESESRLWVLSIGYQLGRRMYPGISDAGADAFAKEFMTRSIGNYYSAQRPAMFQGTLGVAIGLFQTYMLSWAQSAFRSLENREFKALASQMLTQAGLFGMNTVPMYDLFSKTIGEHFSDKHYDLTTGTYRALPTSLAEFIVYGLPASLGVGLYTRGDMQPRIPFASDNPLDTIAAVNATRQILGATAHTLQKVYEANNMADRYRGFLEGLSMQSISRPIARVVEALPTPDGQGGFKAVGSISREGNTIATSDQIWSVPGILSRIVASRSAEEQIKREADYLNSFYGSIDHDNRKSATEALKTAIRGGNLDSDTLDRIATRYLRTGTATGWKAALNEALATSEGGIDYKLGKRLRPDSPLQKMIEENY